MERAVVSLHLKSEVVNKVWRFEPGRIPQYTRSAVENELVKLFPDISRRGLKLNLWYEDDIAGKVSLITLMCLHVHEYSYQVASYSYCA